MSTASGRDSQRSSHKRGSACDFARASSASCQAVSRRSSGATAKVNMVANNTPNDKEMRAGDGAEAA